MRKFDNYSAALDVLARADEQDLGNEFVQGGVIGKFSLQLELGRKLLKELLAYEGDSVAVTGSPRSVIKASFKYFEFMDEETWLAMLRDRNNTAHVYDGAAVELLVGTIIERYIPEFERLRAGLLGRYGAMLA